MRLGLVYLPPKDVSERLVEIAQEIARGKSTRVVLGPEKLAHLSLVHVETEEDPALLWGEAKESAPKTCPINVLGLGLLRYDTPYNAPAADPATMAWLVVPCSRPLRAAEESALALPFVRRSRVTTHNGESFQPHFTIAIWDGAQTDVTLPRDSLSFEGHLALGVIGANGVFERTLFET